MQIKQKLTLSTTLMVFLAVLLVALPTLIKSYRSQTQNLSGQAAYMSQIVYTEVEAFLAEPRAVLDAMAEYARTQELDREVITPFLAGLAARNPDYQYIYYVDAVPYKDGGFLADNLHLDISGDYDQTTRGWFKAAADTDGYIVTDPYMDIMVGGAVITVAERVMKDGKFFGVAAVDIALDKVVAFMENFSLTENGTSYILNSEGLYITNPDTEKVLEANFFSDTQTGTYRKQIESPDGFFALNAGHSKYLVGAPLPDVTGWLFVSTGPSIEVSAGIVSVVTFVGIITLASIVVALLISLFLSKRIAQPLTEVVTAVKGISEGNADLTTRLDTSTNDEVGRLTQNFNKFMEKMQNIVSVMKQSKIELVKAGDKLKASTDETASSINEILASIEGMAGNIENQAGSVQQTAGAVNQISANIESLKQMVETQASGVQQASAAVEEMIGNINSVTNSVSRMAQSFSDLEGKAASGVQKQQDVTDRISLVEEESVTLQDANKAISSIASQTNLLAMNAAIEAAHAGEAGKGFAVVADEIRKLSETSTAQSKTIGTQLKKIQDSIKGIVAASNESRTAFLTVHSGIKATDELVSEITNAMQEQNEGSKQINESLHAMNDSTALVRNASEEMALGSKAILSEISNLESVTTAIRQGMEEMTGGAQKISGTSNALVQVSEHLEESITEIGAQVDQFTT